MNIKTFHILMQNGSLYKFVKVLTETGYASSNAEVYWLLNQVGHIVITKDLNSETKKIYKDDIYYFCLSEKY